LCSFILNRRWLDQKSKRIPSYKEIVAEEDEKEFAPTGANATLPSQTRIDDTIDDEDDEFEERAEEFENKYNFRFEEESVFYLFFNFCQHPLTVTIL
jgi:protein KRI1